MKDKNEAVNMQQQTPKGQCADKERNEIPKGKAPCAECDEQTCESTADSMEIEALLSALKAQADKEKARAEEMTSAAQRLQAEFDNFRKRNIDSASKAREDGAAEVIVKLLPTLDTLDAALAMIPDEKVAAGVKMIQRSVWEMMSGYGVEKLPAIGEEFNPEFHNAVERVAIEDESQSGKVVGVYQEGYSMNGKVLRHSMVRVGE